MRVAKMKENKQRKSAWFYVAIIFGMLLIFSFLFSALGLITGEKIIEDIFGSQNTDFSGGLQNDIETPKMVSINGINVVQTINQPDQTIYLRVNGQYDIITVSKETDISKLDLNGLSNTINLCKGVHSPEVRNNGQNNQVLYNSCE